MLYKSYRTPVMNLLLNVTLKFIRNDLKTNNAKTKEKKKIRKIRNCVFLQIYFCYVT